MLLLLERQQWVMAWSEILILCSGIESGQPGWKPGIVATRPAGGLKQNCPDCSCLWKQEWFKEAKTVKAGTKCIVRNTVHRVAELTEMQSVYRRQRQSSSSHPEEARGCGRAPEWGAHQRSDLNHLSRTVPLGLCFPLANFLVMFRTPDQTQGPPLCVCTSFHQDAFQTKGHGTVIRTYYMAWHPLPFSPRGVSLCVCRWRLPGPEDRGCVASWPFAQAGLAPLCPGHYRGLACPQKTNSSRLPCACCYFCLED